MMRLRLRQKGYALATILVLLGVAMFGVGALVTISTLESKISRSQLESVTAYYVAEAGVEDAMWRINNTPAYSSALAGGTLNITYTTTNVPTTNQGYTVTMQSSVSMGAGYATITVVGTNNNGIFTSQRKVQATVFQGATTAPGGNLAFLSGGAFSMTGGSGSVSITGGDLFSNSPISFNSTSINMHGGNIKTPKAYSANSTTLTNVGGVYAQNCSPPPGNGCQTAPASQTPPAFDFASAQTNANTTYTPAQFQSFVQNSGSTVTIPGPITYISGNLSIGNWAKNKTLNITGELVIMGNVSVSSSTGNLVVNVADPGNGKSGIFVSGNISNSGGAWNINGVYYAASNMSFVTGQQFTLNGAFIAGGAISVNPGLTLTINYNVTPVNAVFSGGGQAQALQTDYWEEEY